MAAWLCKTGKSGAPVVVTLNGRPAGMQLSPEASDELTARARFVSSVTEGLGDADAGRAHSHADAVKCMNDRFGAKPK